MRSRWYVAILAGLVALALAAFVSPFASPHPDGLERVAEEYGFAPADAESMWHFAWAPDYEAPGVPEVLATSVAGVIGTAAVFGVLVAVGFLLTRGTKGRERP
jgi:cobalt/nickel transport protein